MLFPRGESPSHLGRRGCQPFRARRGIKCSHLLPPLPAQVFAIDCRTDSSLGQPQNCGDNTKQKSVKGHLTSLLVGSLPKLIVKKEEDHQCKDFAEEDHLDTELRRAKLIVMDGDQSNNLMRSVKRRRPIADQIVKKEEDHQCNDFAEEDHLDTELRRAQLIVMDGDQSSNLMRSVKRRRPIADQIVKKEEDHQCNDFAEENHLDTELRRAQLIAMDGDQSSNLIQSFKRTLIVDQIVKEEEDHQGMDFAEEVHLDAELMMAQLIDEQHQEEEEDVDDDMDRHPVSQPGTISVGSADSSFPSYVDMDAQAPKPLPFTPSRPLGIDLSSVRRTVPSATNTMLREIDFFLLFFTQDVVTEICGFTNRQGWELVLNCPSYANYHGAWTEVTLDEFYRFMGLLIYMGFTHLPDMSRYWGTNSLQGSWARAFMSRNRFKSLLAALHIVDPATEDNQDRLAKLRYLLDHLKEKCKELFQPKQNLSVDECMVKTKGRTGFKQYMDNKPNSWGFKLWVIAASDSGYTLDFNVYTGSPDSHVTDLATKVVETLVQPFRDQGHNIFFDNFYTSPALMATLRRLGFNACGTCRISRKNFPVEFKDVKKWERKADRGDMRWCRIEQGNILVTQWKDTRAVTYLSNFHCANDSTEVTKLVKHDAVWKRQVFHKPKVIDDYDKHMARVDRSDQMITMYEVLKKNQMWWKTLFFHFIDIAVVNSFLLFQEWQQCHAAPGNESRFAKYTQIDFRENLARQLGGIDTHASFPSHSLKTQPPPSEFHSTHIPQMQDSSRNCWLCYKKNKVENKTKIACLAPECNGKRLCFTRNRNCFQSWHTEWPHNLIYCRASR
ncbi:hypothetical protein SKAU_G00195890 [Synaphobranchus kaupii]|uniref:PiggyBac transposable element-derived protein domain-containing protein n=1 Tax=Synaphobranchus kaupii TaxID=118154 RepID=A0A9Q1FEW0_SYNKA|nr:hypothetical protein SKAU_G00195890 [Synaphobranchus kaupii]